MVVATVRVWVKSDNRQELVQTLSSLLTPIRNQTGCIGSYFYSQLGDENTLCLIEEWETKTDLENHLRSNEFAVLLGAVNLLKGPSDIEFKLLSKTAGIEAVEEARGRGPSRSH